MLLVATETTTPASGEPVSMSRAIPVRSALAAAARIPRGWSKEGPESVPPASIPDSSPASAAASIPASSPHAHAAYAPLGWHTCVPGPPPAHEHAVLVPGVQCVALDVHAVATLAMKMTKRAVARGCIRPEYQNDDQDDVATGAFDHA